MNPGAPAASLAPGTKIRTRQRKLIFIEALSRARRWAQRHAHVGHRIRITTIGKGRKLGLGEAWGTLPRVLQLFSSKTMKPNTDSEVQSL